MNEDQKTTPEEGADALPASNDIQRGKVRVGRVTAPAGTPARSGPPSGFGSGDIAGDMLSSPRTVGGHTARLNVGDTGDSPSHGLGEGPLSSPRSPRMDVRGGALGVVPRPLASAPSQNSGATADRSPPSSRTVGGTMRLAPAVNVLPDAPPLPDDPRLRGPVRAGLSGEPSGLVSPLAVAVGLVFLAVGTMIGLTIEVRRSRSAAPPPWVAVSAPVMILSATTAASSTPPFDPSVPGALPEPPTSLVPSATASAMRQPTGGAGRPPTYQRSRPQPFVP